VSDIDVSVWTDGSCYPNPGGPGGWAAIIIAKAPGVEDSEIMENLTITSDMAGVDNIVLRGKENDKLRWKARILKGGKPPAEGNTNNRMEIQAITEAIRFMKPCKVRIVTDSQYAIGLLSGRNRAKANLDQKLQFQTISAGFDIEWVHVMGHGRDNPNVIADLLAGGEANEYRKATV